MKKNRTRKRTLRFERLETKACPAACLLAVTALPEAEHPIWELRESEDLAATGEMIATQSASSWQFTQAVYALLRFVDEHAETPAVGEAVCSPPTWDQCRVADQMLELRDQELRALVVPAVWSES